jgi:hypothetical protein
MALYGLPNMLHQLLHFATLLTVLSGGIRGHVHAVHKQGPARLFVVVAEPSRP